MSAFKAIKISQNVFWVGAIDNEIRSFHGYSTSRGTTYNAFLILGDKPILIDTVKSNFYNQMMERISSIIDPTKIDYIISNHAEMDHSGCLPKAIQDIKPEKVYASKMGVKALQEHFHFAEGVITEINPAEPLKIGDKTLSFVETRMLHWPDSMFTYLHDDGVLFSQDGFGMHYATDKLFADEEDESIMLAESKKYFANILMPFSGLITKLFSQLPSLNLDIKIIAPDHGPIYRIQKDIDWILSLWQEWARQKPNKKVVITYDTMWGSTASMANAIADGVDDDVEVMIMPLSGFHRSDIVSEVLDAGVLIVGSPTINNQMFPTVAGFLTYLKGLKPKNLIGQAFGSFGWSGESVKLAQQELESFGVELIGNAPKINYVPTDDDLSLCRQLGKDVSEQLKAAVC